MSKWDGTDDWDDEDYDIFENADIDEDSQDEDVSPSHYLTLSDMERDGEAAAAAVEDMLRLNPDMPTKEILAEMRKHVKPLSHYRPTDEEMMALRRADIMHTLRGGKDSDEDEPTDEEEA